MASSYSVFKAKFKKTIADAVYKEITSKTARYYHWFGKENSWQDFLSPFIPANPTTDAPGEPSDNFRYDLHVRRDILTTKLIKPSDVSFIVRRIDWENERIYDMYDDAYDKVEGFGYGPAYSGATRLEDSDFYVLTSEYNVYKCIWNAADSPSTVMPTGTTVDVFTTADGYKWKFMYTIPVGLRNRFLTSEYMPVTTALNANYGSNGAIQQIVIENGGSGYNPSTTYASISGDGYSEKDPYKLSAVLVSNGGYGYTSPPVITIGSPYPTSVEWSANKSVSVGSYISHFNPLENKTNFYKILSGTQLGEFAPIHDDPEGEPISNGLALLQYIATQSAAYAILTSTSVTSVNFTGGAVGQGFGYLAAPQISVAPPITNASPFDGNTIVELNDLISYGGRYYQVTSNIVGQTLSEFGPTHTSGTVTNGDVDLLYIAEDAQLDLVVTKSEATVSLEITPGKDSIYTVNINPSNPGSQYVEPPLISISAPAVGTAATALIESTGIENGSIIAINVINPGNGYLVTPTVIIETPSITIDPTNTATIISDKINYDGHRLLNKNIVTYDSLSGTVIDGLMSGDMPATDIVANSTYVITDVGTTTDWVNDLGATEQFSVIGEISGTTLTITSVSNGTITNGTVISSSSIASGTYIVEQLTSSEFTGELGLTGTYQISTSQTTSSEVIIGQPAIGSTFTAITSGTGDGVVNQAYYVHYVDINNFYLSLNEADVDSGTHIVLDPTTATGTSHKFQLTTGAATATTSLGTGGEIVNVLIDDPGIGYTNCNITVIDTAQVGFDGGAILVADFGVGNVDTVQTNVELLAIPGSIETVKIVDGGSGYGAANVTILGDGTGATARAIVSAGRVAGIEMITQGQGYTWTDIVIEGNAGSTGAVARAIMSPLGGHGSNAIDELNANSLVFYSSISRDKNQGIEILNNDYRKAGLLRNIKQFGTNTRFTADTGSGCVLITGYTIGDPDQKIDVDNIDYDMLLYKDETPDNDDISTDIQDYKKYRVVEFNENQILLSVFNNFTIKEGDVLRTDPSNIGRVPLSEQKARTRIKVQQVSERTIDQFSGDFLFFTVRESFQPTEDQIITIRTTLTL